MQKEVYFKFIVPFRYHFCLNRPLTVMQRDEFSKFIKGFASDALNENPLLKSVIPSAFEITTNQFFDSDNMFDHYEILNSNGGKYSSPDLFHITFKNTEHDVLAPILHELALESDKETGAAYSGMLRVDLNSLKLITYDYSICLIDFDCVVDTNHDLCVKDDGWQDLNSWLNHFVQKVITKIYENYLYDFVNDLMELSQKLDYAFIEKPENYAICRDIVESNGRAKTVTDKAVYMWVSRFLVMPKGRLSNQWIKSIRASFGDKLLNFDGGAVTMAWGDKMIEFDDGVDEIDPDILEGIYLSEYYYGVYDVVNTNLSSFIGATFDTQSNKEVHDYSKRMDKVISSVNILKIRYQDTEQEIRGLVRKSFFSLLHEEWDFKTLEKMTTHKLDSCKANLTRLSQIANTRSQGRVQFVLTILAGLGILNLMIALGAQSRKLAKDNVLEHDSVPGIADLALAFSFNELGWIGIICAIIAGTIIMMNRPK